jgi:hypothetical protein
LLYTSFTAFSVVGSPVVRRMGSRRALVLGTSGYLLFIAANLAPSWYVTTQVAGSGCFCCNFCVLCIFCVGVYDDCDVSPEN